MEKAIIMGNLIKESGMSVRAFAEKCGLPESTVYTILKNGVGKANVNNVISMCKALQITVEELDNMAKGVTSIDSKLRLSDSEQTHMKKYRAIDEKGKHTVDTVLDMEYNRVYKPHLVPLAAHAREGATDEEMQHDLELLRKIKEKHNRG